jgi:hypothetical protein
MPHFFMEMYPIGGDTYCKASARDLPRHEKTLRLEGLGKTFVQLCNMLNPYSNYNAMFFWVIIFRRLMRP